MYNGLHIFIEIIIPEVKKITKESLWGGEEGERAVVWNTSSQTNSAYKCIQSAVFSGKCCALLPPTPLRMLRCKSVLNEDGFFIQRWSILADLSAN